MAPLSAAGDAAPAVEPVARALVFIGFMGAGKSTAATAVAAALGVRGARQRQAARAAPRALDRARVRSCTARPPSAPARRSSCASCSPPPRAGGPATVIALGGGSVLSARVREALAPHLVVLLDIDAALAWERVRGDAGAAAPDALERPLARDREAFAALHAERGVLYESLADAILPADRAGVALRALPALRALAAAAPNGRGAQAANARLLWASAASGEYPVLVGRGLLGGVLAAPQCWPLERGAARAFCVTDETVGALYAQRLGELAALIAIPPGESHKTLASAERVWRELARAGMTRADHLVALGGGVVGDLAGFCAATYQRGVPVVQVPTTLVAQVDSAYGGKTGVDLPEAKNYVGAYHQPAAVIVDPDALATLPAAELDAGWVEVLKTALIAGGELWERIAADEPLDERAILACARLKLAVVAEDERDARAPPGAEPGAHGRPRDRDGHRLRPLPPRRGRRPGAARRAAPLRPRGPARAGPRAARGAPSARDPQRRRRRGRRPGRGPRQEASRGAASRSCCSTPPGRCASAARSPRRSCAPRSPSWPEESLTAREPRPAPGRPGARR